MMIDKNKQYKTSSGLPVRIYATDCLYTYPVHGVVFDHHGSFEFGWTNDGLTFINQVADCELDLVEIDCEEGEGL